MRWFGVVMGSPTGLETGFVAEKRLDCIECSPRNHPVTGGRQGVHPVVARHAVAPSRLVEPQALALGHATHADFC